ncbi:MaoC family dehydratase [Caulobacter hibisci]|uniref:Protein dehydratase n=1 Tax=Caulobacter hibisci TaxID=2035993 RepID=A0ABS0SVL2_9CAUL|nr:MaoC/PaaZ C-terminal domain-containing protein [Caulobacter hibisci]MBI1683651.1 protein dehydratase [Caulobacter hibisci]
MGDAEPLSPLGLAWGAARGLLRGRQDRDLPPTALRADQVWIRAEAVMAYAELCGFAPEHGVPPTYAHILAFPLQMRILLAADFPFPAVGLVHIHNHIRQSAPLRIGEAVTVTARTGRLLAHDRGQAFSLVAKVLRGGETIWRGESVYLRLGKAGHGAPAPKLDGETAEAPIETWKVPADIGRRYARVSGDANPIHTWALGARLFGFKRPIAHGMWAKARAVAALTRGRAVEAIEVETAFRAPLLLPGEARLAGGPDGAFELTDGAGRRTHLRGRLTLSPQLQDPSPC